MFKFEFFYSAEYDFEFKIPGRSSFHGCVDAGEEVDVELDSGWEESGREREEMRSGHSDDCFQWKSRKLALRE